MVWRSGDIWYYSYVGGAVAFATQKEAQQFMAKLDTAKAIIRAVQSLALATDTAADLESEYFDTQGTGWVDADVEPLGISAAALASCVSVLGQVNALMTNQATTPAMYRSTLNAVRRVMA